MPIILNFKVINVIRSRYIRPFCTSHIRKLVKIAIAPLIFDNQTADLYLINA